MNTVSVSQLKTHPSKVIAQAIDYPVAVERRNKVKAYLIGRKLYEKIIAYLEDYIDRKEINEADFHKGKDFEDIAKELNI